MLIIVQAVPIYTDESKGMLTPAALVDIDGDNIEDIIIATFNSHVIAFRWGLEDEATAAHQAFLIGQSRRLFRLFSSFSNCDNNYSFNFNNINWRKHKWFAWDSNQGPQDGRRRWNHGAMSAALK